MKNRRVSKYAMYILLAVLICACLFPYYWILNTSLKTEKNVMSKMVQYFPDPITFESYVEVWESGLSGYFFNSLLVSMCVLLIVVVITLMSGYSLARYHFKYKGLVTLLFLISQMVPPALLIVPLFMIYRDMKLLTTHLPQIITLSATQISFCSIMMSGLLAGTPVEIEEAAMVDGCTRISAIFRVILPIALPGIVATGSFAFVGAWNDYLYNLMFASQANLQTLPVALKNMIGLYTVDYAKLAAGTVLTLIPTLIIFGYLQKHLVSGLSAGAVKG